MRVCVSAGSLYAFAHLTRRRGGRFDVAAHGSQASPDPPRGPARHRRRSRCCRLHCFGAEDRWAVPGQPRRLAARALSEAQADAIPVGAVSYPAPGQKRLPGSAGASRKRAHVAQGPACTLYANDPFLTAPRGRKAVEASGAQLCSQGINQRTRACLYKQHHVLFVPYFKRTHCGPVRPDRRATFRAVSTTKPCARGGTGRWRTVIFGSIYYNGPAGPGRYSGDVRSENDKSFSHCN
jgi:hypothetical protein